MIVTEVLVQWQGELEVNATNIGLVSEETSKTCYK